MTKSALLLLLTLTTTSGTAPSTAASQAGKQPVRICADQAHGEAPLVGPYAPLAEKIGAAISTIDAKVTEQALAGCRLLLVRVPQQPIAPDERDAIVAFVKQGGSLLLAFDEERRAPIATKVNDVIAPFGMKLTDDIEYLHNNGALAKKGAIHAADREVPFSGGRAVEGGEPFAWQLDKDGKPAQVFAASTTVGPRGRVVVLADAMATLFMGVPEGVRLTGVPRDPSRTTYWGKDSSIFMEELLTWLIR